MNEPRFCRDCKHRVDDFLNKDMKFSRCVVAAIEEVNVNYFLVDGTELAPSLLYCAIARGHGKPCGPDAKLFEPALQNAELTFADQP